MEPALTSLHRERRLIYHEYHANQERTARCLHHVQCRRHLVDDLMRMTDTAMDTPVEGHSLLAVDLLLTSTAAAHHRENVEDHHLPSGTLLLAR